MNNTRHACALWRASILIFAAVFGVEGCGAPAPKTETVKGKIAIKGNPGRLIQLVGGKIWFQSTSNPDVMAMGVIDEDGTFSMNAFLPNDSKGYRGVVPGEYKVRVELQPRENDKSKAESTDWRYEDFNRSGITLKVPVAGIIQIEVEPPGR